MIEELDSVAVLRCCGVLGMRAQSFGADSSEVAAFQATYSGDDAYWASQCTSFNASYGGARIRQYC
jgi:hypothetical protein